MNNFENTLFPMPAKTINSSIKHNTDKAKTYPVNIHHKSEYDVFIGRGSKWGNPWTHVPSKYAKYVVSTREEAIKQYYQWIQGQTGLLADLYELEGKRLGCYCYPNNCHGDILGLLSDTVHIGESILNNTKYYSSFTITEKQYEVMDERRLAMLADVTSSEYICIKKKGDVSGIKYIDKANKIKLGDKLQINNNETSFGPGLCLLNVSKSIKESLDLPNYKINNEFDVVEITGEDVWYLIPVYSNEIDKNNEILISPKDYGKVTKIFSTQSELDEYVKHKRKENLTKK